MFQSARFKLTAWYLLMIMLVSLFFSVVIYANVDRELVRLKSIQEESRARAEEYFGYAPPARVTTIIEENLIDEARQNLLWDLAILNACIFLIAGWVGHFLAGRTLNPIKDVLDMQARFLGDASHELKTPLTSLRAEIEIFLRSKNKTFTQSKKILKSNLEEVVRLQKLTDSILVLSMLEKAGLSYQFDKQSIATIVEYAISNVSKLASNKGIKISSKIRNTEIYGHKKSLVELFTILLDNAIKYSKKGSKVSIQSTSANGYIKSTVEDNGIGISDKDIDHIFERFYRAEKSRSDRTKSGYGLGLSIAREIATLHSGTISVKSSRKGSVFTVMLPKS
jgi:signal transduction histidine kinase